VQHWAADPNPRGKIPLGGQAFTDLKFAGEYQLLQPGHAGPFEALDFERGKVGLHSNSRNLVKPPAMISVAQIEGKFK
jgi:hypothetical protein